VLGDTLELIASEKAKIMKQNCNVVMAKQEQCVLNVLEEEAKRLSCPAFVHGVDWKYERVDDFFCLYEDSHRKLKTPLPSLLGQYQIINAGTAIAALFHQNKFKISEKSVADGVGKTVWDGRIQKIENTVLNEYAGDLSELYVDGAHNEGGARVLSEWIGEENKKAPKRNVLILSIIQRKDSLAFLKNIRNNIDEFIIVNHPNDPNAGTSTAFKEGDVLKTECESLGLGGVFVVDSVEEALKTVDKKAPQRVVLCGSLYFVGDVLEIVKNGKTW
jgi:dihydrofolate synthase/folylpolyglutamate synthase